MLKFSIITPVYNGEKYIEECILSVKKQTYACFEHIIVDGGSTDGTLDIIKKYEGAYPMRYISEKDNGMYDAINKGFQMANGDVYAWLNSDDMYMPYAFEIVAEVMKNEQIKWCTGVPVVFSPTGIMYNVPKTIPIFMQSFLRKGYMDGRIYSMVQQESTFWRRELWEKVGGVRQECQLAGDYWLWRDFAKYEKLYTVDAIVGGFRRHENQKSTNIARYYEEVGNLNLWKKFMAKFKIIRIITNIVTLPAHPQFIKIGDIYLK